MDIKKKLHHFILTSDLSELKKYVDQMQISLLQFDDPSLLMMAIDIYLNPMEILHEDLQLEIVIFLAKCGLGYYVPGGRFFFRIWSYYDYWTDDQEEENKEFDQKVKLLMKKLLEDDSHPVRKQLFTDPIPDDAKKYRSKLILANDIELKTEKNCNQKEKTKVDDDSRYDNIWYQLERHQAAYKIQNWWRNKREFNISKN